MQFPPFDALTVMSQDILPGNVDALKLEAEGLAAEAVASSEVEDEEAAVAAAAVEDGTVETREEEAALAEEDNPRRGSATAPKAVAS